MTVYRAGAGPHEKWAVDQIREGKDTLVVTSNLRRIKSGVEKQAELWPGKRYEHDGEATIMISQSTLTRLAHAPQTTDKILSDMRDLENAISAANAAKRVSGNYWADKAFAPSAIPGRQGGTQRLSTTIARAVQEKRYELGLERPPVNEGRVSATYEN